MKAGQHRSSLGRAILAGLGCAFVLAAPAAFAQAYTVIDLGALGAGSCHPQGINQAGWVTGYSYLGLYDSQPHAFIYTNGVMQDLGTLGGSWSWGFGINNTNQVAGESYTATGYYSSAFRWTNGVMTQIGAGVSARAGFAINNLGHVAGYLQTGSGYAHAYLYGGSKTDLGTLGGNYSYAYGINDSDRVVGWAEVSPGGFQLAFLWDGSMHSLGTLGGNMSHAYGINNSGQVVGWANYTTSDNNVYRPFLYSGGMQDLGTLGGTNGQALAINNLGQVVGSSETTNGGTHAFFYNGTGMFDLNSLIPTNSGWTLTEATAINDNGQIVGYGTSPSGATHGFLLTPATAWQAWQIRYFRCIDCPQTTQPADPDGDGQNNLAEFLAGTDPTNPASVFQITSIVTTGSAISVTWTMGSGKTNALQVTTGDTSRGYTDNFTNLFIVTNTVGSVTNYLDAGGATNAPPRFYRVHLVP
ncbi:MAG TPA: DUF3466 family protein [Verrucomicrobiae bacterium]|nr:DUF3466 family protein [Verrucomicrobiae bacterium]